MYELYEYIVFALNERCHPSNDESIYPDNECWNWDSETRTKANGLRHTFTNFEHIVSFICAKEMLEPMRPLLSSLQGELMEMYLGFEKIDQVIESYQLIRDDIDSWFNRVYAKVLRLAESIGSHEQCPRMCRRQRNRKNHPSDSVAQYWKVTTVIPFLDIVYSELKSRVSEDKHSHYELCALVLEVIMTKSSESLLESCQVLLRKWEHIMPLSSAFDSELFRWQQCCKSINTYMSVTTLLTSYADNKFFPNVRELLKILAVLPVGSTEAERSFSCLRRLHTWLRNTMKTDRLSNFVVIAMYGYTIPITCEQICTRFIAVHPRCMQRSSLFDIDN